MFKASKLAAVFARGYILLAALMFVGGFFTTIVSLMGD